MHLGAIQSGIQERQEELHRIAELLGRAAALHGRRSNTARVITITLGAFVATQAVAEKVWGTDNVTITVAYALFGVVIAAVSGLEAAFRTESRAAALRTLASHCQSTLWQIDTEWRKSIGSTDYAYADADRDEHRITAAKALLDRQDQVIGEVQTKAAELGEDITVKVRELYGPDMPAAA